MKVWIAFGILGSFGDGVDGTGDVQTTYRFKSSLYQSWWSREANGDEREIRQGWTLLSIYSRRRKVSEGSLHLVVKVTFLDEKRVLEREAAKERRVYRTTHEPRLT